MNKNVITLTGFNAIGLLFPAVIRESAYFFGSLLHYALRVDCGIIISRKSRSVNHRSLEFTLGYTSNMVLRSFNNVTFTSYIELAHATVSVVPVQPLTLRDVFRHNFINSACPGLGPDYVG